MKLQRAETDVMRHSLIMPQDVSLAIIYEDIDDRGRRPLYDWLETHIGTRKIDWEWDSVSYNKQIHWEFYFKHEEDKVKFILRWL